MNSLTKKETKSNWKQLFNGQDFAGWHGYNLKEVPDCWIIEDNSLTMTTEGHVESYDLLTDRTYKNFAFSAEFKLTKGANSGIIFQVKKIPLCHI